MSAKRKSKKSQEIPMTQGRLGRALDLPPGIFSGGAHIRLVGDREATVEGCRGVLEYNAERIKLNIGCGTVCFCGRGLRLAQFDREHTCINGKIESVNYDM